MYNNVMLFVITLRSVVMVVLLTDCASSTTILQQPTANSQLHFGVPYFYGNAIDRKSAK